MTSLISDLDVWRRIGSINMNMDGRKISSALLAFSLWGTTYAWGAQKVSLAFAENSAESSRQTMKRAIADWPDRVRLGAMQTMARYGPPQEITFERLVWHDVGPVKRITALRDEVPHDFPLPHVDFLEYTVQYKVPLGRTADVLAFDGSVIINRTAGEMSVRCDGEAHNFLILNLAHDIAAGKKSLALARMELAEISKQEVLGNRMLYEQSLQFEPATIAAARFSDTTMIVGAPVRVADSDPEEAAKMLANGARQDSAEMLATMIAIDMNAIQTAAVATRKNLPPAVATYARVLGEEHGRNVVETMRVGRQIEVTPVNTEAVTRLQERGAAELAILVPLNASIFERGFLKTTVEAYRAALRDLDDMIGKPLEDLPLRRHLIANRQRVEAHIAEAKRLQRAIATSSL